MSNQYKIHKTEIGYSFETDKGVPYIIYLEKSSFAPPYGDFLYDFSFSPHFPKKEREREQNGFDPKICQTIICFLEDLFDQDSRNSVVFTCDSSDGREVCRKRLFDKWYEGSSFKRFEKLDFKLVNTGDDYSIPIYITILTLLDNPHLEELNNFANSNMEDFESNKVD
ncbi:DUF6169 family protein [Arthrospiribacter ruber]|uniref:DUF6169 family protein n=1 Tax=Arthrospiribacter ruber TaxID=2487934 RepID=UPI001C5A7D03|nr:DUF6169 family protein [Arthrospiribacter ruber]